jgi:hypothetical protein
LELGEGTLMAGWTDISAGDFDWHDVDLLNEFVAAINERADLINDTAMEGPGTADKFTTKVAGEDVQDATGVEKIKEMQDWCLTNCVYFCPNFEYDAPNDEYDPADYDGNATIINWTASNFKGYIAGFAVTPPSPHFRAYTTHPDDGGAVAYRSIAEGDIIGPWIFQDLQKALNGLVWTQHAQISLTNKASRSAANAATQATAQDAYDDAVTQWASSSWVGGGSAQPTTEVQVYGSGASWDASLSRWRAKFVFSGLPSTPTADVEGTYIYHGDPNTPGGEDPADWYDNMGDSLPPTVLDVFTEWLSGSGLSNKGGGTTSLTTNILGDYSAAPDNYKSWSVSGPASGWQAHSGQSIIILNWGHATNGSFVYYE